MKSDVIFTDQLGEPLVQRLARLWTALRITVPSPQRDPARERMEEALARLAETSPHLMHDIGFTEQRHERCGRRVWVRGSLRVEGRG